MEAVIALWLIGGIVTGVIAQSKGLSFLPWALYGFAIWPVAIVHVLVAKPTVPRAGEKTCPKCAEFVKAEALVCKHCGADFPAVPAWMMQAGYAPQSPPSPTAGKPGE